MIDHWPGKAAIVTGACRGQGAALAVKLLSSGALVYAVDQRPLTDPAWSELEAAASGSRGKLVRLHYDIADPDAWEAIAALAGSEAGQPVHALVNNAGITGDRAVVTKAALSEWDRVIATNLTGAFLATRHIAPLMPRGGAILNVSSTVGLTGYFSAAYTTSKWGLRGLTRASAMELAVQGVRVNCICPGVVDTKLLGDNQGLREALSGVVPLGEIASPEQIADVMFFLLSPESSYMTGTDVVVDGGIIGAGLYLPAARSGGYLPDRPVQS